MSIVVVAFLQIKPDHLEKWKAIVPEIVRLSREQPGTEHMIGE
jgi:quinol monooxygenase YgiN